MTIGAQTSPFHPILNFTMHELIDQQHQFTDEKAEMVVGG